MDEKNYSGVIPEQHVGEVISAETNVECRTIEEAKSKFEVVKRSLLDVNNWQRLAGEDLARFQLADANGQDVEGPARQGFYFKIDIPGPGSKTGDGFDWVIVEKIEEHRSPSTESLGIRVRPASNPATTDEDTAHFYSEDSTSNFTVTREGTKITAAVYDKNTKPNTNSDSFVDKVRNVVVGIVGIFSFSKIQWKSLTDGLIKQNT